MKFVSMFLLTLALIVPAVAADDKPKNSKDTQLQSDLFAKEKAFWDAWIKKDTKPFEEGLATDAVLVDGSGVSDRAGAIKMISAHNCEVKSYSFAEEKLTPIDKDAVILTYKATQDGACGGQKIPESVYSSSVWKKEGGKWRNVSHQETPVTPSQPPQQ